MFSALVLFKNFVAPNVRPPIMVLPDAPYMHEYANVREWVTELANHYLGRDFVMTCGSDISIDVLKIVVYINKETDLRIIESIYNNRE